MTRFFTTILLTLSIFCINAQKGLEKVLVEKYYITNAEDSSNDSGGKVEVGATTYRIYVDMLPGYIFQAAYGNQAHELKIATTTTFFNNEDRGAKFPTYTKSQAANNTVMLDSWLSVGAACKDHIGVLKTDDNGVGTVVNKDGILKNSNNDIGVPLTTQDGMIAGVTDLVTEVGLGDLLAMFDSSNDTPAPNVFSATNGAWSSLQGAKGADTLTNRVLIAQLTTTGVLTFELNLQIRSKNGGVENYVAKNPTGNELTISSLVYPDTSTSKTFELLKNDFAVFPNPVNDEINIVFDKVNTSKNTYMIYDMTGAVVKSGTLSTFDGQTNAPINISNLREGAFLIQVSFDGISKTSKFIKL